MKVVLRDISGKSFEHEFPIDSNCFDVCKYIASQINTTDNHIFLVSPKNGNNYYQNDATLHDIVSENPEFVVFLCEFDDDENKHNNSEESQIIGCMEIDSTNMVKLPSPEDTDIYKLLKNARHTKNEGKSIYKEYANIYKFQPKDLAGRIKHIQQLGYDIEDCKSALRLHRYNVGEAIRYLMKQNSNEDEDNENGHSNSHNLNHKHTNNSSTAQLTIPRDQSMNIILENQSRTELNTENANNNISLRDDKRFNSFNEINDRVPLRRMATEGFRNDSNEWIVDSSETKLGDDQNEPSSQNLSILNPATRDPDATDN